MLTLVTNVNTCGHVFHRELLIHFVMKRDIIFLNADYAEVIAIVLRNEYHIAQSFS